MPSLDDLKKRIKSVRPLLEQMAFNEFTTKHTLS